MAYVLPNALSDEYIDILNNMIDVENAKSEIMRRTKGSIYFTIKPSADIKNALSEILGLDLSSTDTIPMRWIVGDTEPHIDKGMQAFQNTYLLYLTTSSGDLVIDKNYYPIIRGHGYRFPEGLLHKTISTGSVPRLLVGPMSEKAFAVGSSISRPQGTTIYFKDIAGALNYSIDNQASWIAIGNNFPIQIANSTLSPTEVLTVEFVGDLTFGAVYGTTQFFWCQSSHIQFGSKSLNADGTKPTITINFNSYDGLIQNGDDTTPGFSNIYVYNLNISASGRSPQIGAGWIGKKGFGNGKTDNYIINCSSNGNLPGGAIGSGGIVGSYAAIGSGAQLTIIGCSSSGSIGQLDGGIVGAYAGYNGGSVTCQKCWTTGVINAFGGGIFGERAGALNGSATAEYCYSTNSIGSNAGGIYSRYAGSNSGAAYATQCYSRGSIGADGGGIYGLGAGSDFSTTAGLTRAINCYSSGLVTTSGNGIFGTGKVNSTATNCYIANNSWSTISANSQLVGYPSGANRVGTVWVSTGVSNTAFELNELGFTPYSATIINSSNSMIRTFSQSITAGQNSSAALVSSKNYEIIQKNDGDSGSYSTININSTTGVISTTSDTVAGSYTLTIRNDGSYNITVFTLTVTTAGGGGGSSTDESTCCQQTLDLQGVDYSLRYPIVSGNVLIATKNTIKYPMSYTDLMNMKKAYASKR